MDSQREAQPPARLSNPSRLARNRPKRRLATACFQCRSQKVRCVRLDGQQRCVNCNMGNKPCTLMSNSGSMRPPTLPPPSQTRPVPAKAWTAEPDSNTALEELVQSPPGLSDDHFNQLILEALSPSNATSQGGQSPEPGNILPHVASMNPKDVRTLNYQGCFTIPNQETLEPFFQQYFLHIHPLFPLLNEAEFWESLRHSSAADLIISGQLSLFLLYGILYTSASYVPTSLIRGLGFHNIHQAKNDFHSRAKLLYESGFEKSPVAISQAAVLLSHCYFTKSSTLNSMAPMWLTIAIQNAKLAGAPDYNSLSLTARPNTIENERRRQILKRLWWTCIIRDRVMPIAARHNIRINRSVFDFDSNPILDASDFAEEIRYSSVYDPDIKKRVVLVLLKFVELCVVLTDVLSVSYIPGRDGVHTAMQQAEQATRIRDCRAAMQAWHESYLNLRLEDNAVPVTGELTGSSSAFVVLFANIVSMYYHSANVALSHQEMLIFGPYATNMGLDAIMGNTPSGDRVQMDTSGMVQCLMKLVHFRVADMLPLSVVGIAMHPLTLQIVDLKLLSNSSSRSQRSSDAVMLRQQQTRFIGVIEAMQMCRPRFPAVDWVLSCIRVNVEAFYKLLFSSNSSWNANGHHLPQSRSWTDILRQQPNFYLSLATQIDFSLSAGHMPTNSDLPLRLRTMESPQQNGSNTFHYSVLPESFSLGDIDILNRVQVHSRNLWAYEESVGDTSESYFSQTEATTTSTRVTEIESPEENGDKVDKGKEKVEVENTMGATMSAIIEEERIQLTGSQDNLRRSQHDIDAEHEAYVFGKWIDEVAIF
ncbi:hypothetical protein BGZ63DRAFT_456210 [Mariannaea sp. PMI_226]|nr:hypothetical protein BGZ63DRAFT_456210 [Mariannaea sp. PMI_226]